MCQASGIIPDLKYQSDGGPGIKDICSLIKQNSYMPVKDLRTFLTFVLFNYLIGNCDAHSKNYSFIYDKKGNLSLSPLYDAVSTKAYPSLTQKMSMKIGSHYELNKINDDDFMILADEANVSIKMITEIKERLQDKIKDCSSFTI